MTNQVIACPLLLGGLACIVRIHVDEHTSLSCSGLIYLLLFTNKTSSIRATWALHVDVNTERETEQAKRRGEG